MATKSRAEMIVDILENLRVLAAGQSASAEDETITGSALDSVHDDLVREGLAPYALSAVPEWAQIPLTDVVSFKLCKKFGVVGVARQEFAQDAEAGRDEMKKNTTGKYDSRVVVPFTNF
jgi:hypothetical protein